MDGSKELFASVWKDTQLLRFLSEPRARIYSRTQAALDLFDRMAAGRLVEISNELHSQSVNDEPGFVANYSEFAQRWNWSWRQVKDFIDGLEKLGFLSVEKKEKKQLYKVNPMVISMPFLSAENLIDVAVYSVENPAVSTERAAAYFEEYFAILERRFETGKAAKNAVNLEQIRTVMRLLYGALSGYGCGFSFRSATSPSFKDDQLFETTGISFAVTGGWTWKKWTAVVRKINDELSTSLDWDEARFIDLRDEDREKKLHSWLPFLKDQELNQVKNLISLILRYY